MSEEEVKDPQAVLAELRRAQEDLKTLRSENKNLQTQLEGVNEDAVNKWRIRAVKAEAKVHLESQGVKDADRILKYVDLKDVDFDENEKLVNFDDKITTIKTDFPELFDVKRRVGGKADISTKDAPDIKRSGTEAQVARLFHKS
jgi:hypothetical protein